MNTEEDKEKEGDLLGQLTESIKRISALPDCRTVSRNMYCNLTRRVKLLRPLVDELKHGEARECLRDDVVQGLEALNIALDSAFLLLNSIHQGSKISQALQIDKIGNKFEDVSRKIEAALSQIPYKKLDIPEDVRDQFELLHTQFRRAVEQVESSDLQLVRDIEDAKMNNPDPVVFQRLSEKLNLRTPKDIEKESDAIHDMAGRISEEYLKTMTYLLGKLGKSLPKGTSDLDGTEIDKNSIKHRSPVIPPDFCCPISLELMKDPVIVSTGQTYERSYIQKWLDAGKRTCPKTKQMLSHTALTPNYALKSLIALWCESNGVELPGKSRGRKPGSSGSDCDRESINSILRKLTKGNQEQQRAAAGELRLLAKRHDDNRVCIAEAGAIPLLVEFLSSPDSRTQEHAVTALLNLSINDANKGIIVSKGAIPYIVAVLKNGSTETRENAAATLFSLSAIDENKVIIGSAGAIQPLIDLLQQGTPRGKKDAATAIFNLCIYPGNKLRAVRAGIVEPLMSLLTDPGSGMVDEALAILAIIATHQEGKIAVTQAETVPILVEFIRIGSSRNRENAAALLWSLCTGNLESMNMARELGVEEALKDLAQNGTERAKRKAGGILELLQRAEDEKAVPP